MTGIIILDGPDACGKSTLQDYFVEYHEAVAIHLTYPAPSHYKDMYDYQHNEMLTAITLSQRYLVIVDRHWISEQIYAKVFRGGSPWPEMGKEMDKVWKKHKALYIMCVPYSSMFQSTMQRHKDNLDSKHPYTDEKYHELLCAYHDFTYAGNDAFALRMDVITYNIESYGTNLPHYCDLVLKVLANIQKREV